MRKITISGALLVLEQLVLASSTFIFAILATNSLSVEQYGFLSVNQYLLVLCGVVVTLSLNGILFQRLCTAISNKVKSSLLGTVLLVQVLMSCIAALMISLYNSSSSTEIFLIGVVFGVANIFRRFEVFSYFWKSQIKSQPILVARFFSRVLALIYVFILFVYEKNEPILFSLYFLVEAAVYAAFLYYSYGGKLGKEVRFRYSLLFPLLNKVKSEIINNFAIALSLSLPVIMLAQSQHSGYVAPLSLALTLLTLFSNISNAICDSFYKTISTTKSLDKKLRLAENYIRVSFLFSLILIFTFNFLGGWIISTLFGNKYLPYIEVFYWVSYLLIFVLPSRILFKLVYMVDAQSKNKFRVLPASFFSMLVSILFIEDYGVMASVLAFFSYYIIGDLLGYLLNNKLRPFGLLYFKAIFSWRGWVDAYLYVQLRFK